MILKLPNDLNKLKDINAGDVIELTATIFTARDAAHLRLKKLLENNEKIPVDFSNSMIYYAGPTPTKPNQIIGSIGPTTSSRMDSYAEMTKKLGVVATIGKGPRNKECYEQYVKNKILYFITTGGCGALISKSIKKAEEIAFLDLGPESIKRLEVENFKMICAIDYKGNNIFERNK